MDNQNFEQQFMQNIKNASQSIPPQSAKSQIVASQPVAPAFQEEKSKPPFLLIISIILAVIVVLQSIVLIIVVNNYFAVFNDDDEEQYEETEEITEEENTVYIYNNEENLVAMAATCTADDGSYLKLDKNNNYEEYGTISSLKESNSHVTNNTGNASSSLIDSGTYSITRDSVFNFDKSSGEKRTLFYDGFTLTDGTIFYDCEENYEDEPEE